MAPRHGVDFPHMPYRGSPASFVGQQMLSVGCSVLVDDHRREGDAKPDLGRLPYIDSCQIWTYSGRGSRAQSPYLPRHVPCQVPELRRSMACLSTRVDEPLLPEVSGGHDASGPTGFGQSCDARVVDP